MNPFAATGSYSASGGDATSGNGDVGFSNTSEFGGISIGNGVPSWALLLGGIAIAFILVKK